MSLRAIQSAAIAVLITAILVMLAIMIINDITKLGIISAKRSRIAVVGTPTILENGEIIVTVENIGQEPLKVIDIEAKIGGHIYNCTKDYTPVEIPPGETRTIQCHLSSQDGPLTDIPTQYTYADCILHGSNSVWTYFTAIILHSPH